MNFEEIHQLAEGPDRTAALVAWVQGLYEEDGATPVLVGGAAVELYTGGAYTTGDIDLVGSVTAPVARHLRQAGFERHGRHWVHEPAQVFVEFPGDALEPHEKASWFEIAGKKIRIISAEDLLIDRLGSWEYWQSSVDGVNALYLWQIQKEQMNIERLEQLVTRAGWQKAWKSLLEFVSRWEREDPPADTIEEWANEGP